MKIWIGILTAAVAFIGVACVNLYTPFIEFNGDNAGTFISALGVLVTALVGWQIYNAIEMRTIVREHDKLSHQLIRSANILANQDRRNIELIEAFHCLHIADNHNIDSISHLTLRYIALLRAILHFVNANMSFDYRPFSATRNELSNLLDRLEQYEPSKRLQFNNHREVCDSLYIEIINALDIHIHELQEIRQFLRQTHDRRIKLHQTQDSTR